MKLQQWVLFVRGGRPAKKAPWDERTVLGWPQIDKGGKADGLRKTITRWARLQKLGGGRWPHKPDLQPHDCRHTRITELRTAGLTPEQVAN